MVNYRVYYNGYFGDVPKRLKGPHSKCGRPGNRCEGSNPSISVLKIPIYEGGDKEDSKKPSKINGLRRQRTGICEI